MEAKIIKSKTDCFMTTSKEKSTLTLAITKAKIAIKNTRAKYNGLDLLKKLVIINCFCIFAL